MMDVVVIGGGPAGISAALTLRQRGKSVAVISADAEQSHLAKAEKINNYPGMVGMSGKEMLDVMLSDDLNEFQYIVQDDTWIVNLR